MSKKKWKKNWSKFNYVYFFLFAIILVQIVIIYLKSQGNFLEPTSGITDTFASNFIEWFGVLYSILLPLILVRVWEQLDDIDREFDREADVVRILFEDLYFLRGKNKEIGKKVSTILREYVRHVIKKYPQEVKENNLIRRTGDEILIRLRKQFNDLITPETMDTKDSEFLIKELFQRLNEIVDIRGDRIGFASQRLFETFRIVALIASIIFIVPYYIVGFTISAGVLDYVLIIGVTLLVVFVYLIIEDFDEPFGGTWKIDDEAWYILRHDMVCRELQERRLNYYNSRERNNKI